MKAASTTLTLLLTMSLGLSINSEESRASNGHHSSANHKYSTSNFLELRIADPGCPACLHALRKYLKSLTGIRQVQLPDLNRRGQQRLLIEFDSKLINRGDLLKNIEHRDFKITGTTIGARIKGPDSEENRPNFKNTALRTP